MSSLKIHPAIQEISLPYTPPAMEGPLTEEKNTKLKLKILLSHAAFHPFLETSGGIRKCPPYGGLFEARPRSTSNLTQVSEQVLKSKVSRLLPIYTGLKTMI